VFLFGVVFVLLQSVLFGKQMLLVLSVNSSVLWNIVLILAWVCVIPCAPLFFVVVPPFESDIVC